MQIYLGVDIGANGGLAWNDSSGKVYAEKMPTTRLGVMNFVRRMGIGDCPIKAVAEAVHAFPGQGVCSVWSFAQQAERILMALAAEGIITIEIPPATWQKKFALGTTLGQLKKIHGTKAKTVWKNILKDLASKLHPDLKVTLATADALLIRHWAQETQI